MAHDVIDLKAFERVQRQRAMDKGAENGRCWAGRDGDCYWDKCPQLTDYQSYCPRAKASEAKWREEGYDL
jgi:hypothetical protein